MSVEVARAVQAPEAKSAQRTPTSAAAAVGATLTIALRPADSGTETIRYSYSAGGDGTTLTLTTGNVVVDLSVTLPGGLALKRRSATHNTWAYPNIHGDVTFTLGHNGQMTGPFLYDPYGQPLTGDSNTGPGDFHNGWVGQHQRPTEHQAGLRPTIDMEARPYRPELGRFLRIDPIPGGATDSNYGYVDDPINAFDISGQCGVFGNPFKKCGKGHKGFLSGFRRWVSATACNIKPSLSKASCGPDGARDRQVYKVYETKIVRPVCKTSQVPVFGSYLPSNGPQWFGRWFDFSIAPTLLGSVAESAGLLPKVLPKYNQVTGYASLAATTIDLTCPACDPTL